MILLGWIFGILNGAVGAPAEPLWVLFDPWVVGRALKGDIERDFHPPHFGFIEEALKVLKSSK